MLQTPVLDSHASVVLGATIHYSSLLVLLPKVLRATNFLRRCIGTLIEGTVEEVDVDLRKQVESVDVNNVILGHLHEVWSMCDCLIDSSSVPWPLRGPAAAGSEGGRTPPQTHGRCEVQQP